MRILLTNKFYYARGGDCIYTMSLEKLLKSHGHEVAIFSMQYPDNIQSEWSRYWPSEMTKTKALTRPFGDGETRKKFTDILDAFRPDVVHLNNIHTQLSPIIAEIAHRKGIKVVWTLHDYKLVCPRYDCLQNGIKICEECFTNKKAILKHSCLKNSKLASMVGYIEARKWNRERLLGCVDTFICPTKFMADIMTKNGYDNEKIYALHHFMNLDLSNEQPEPRQDYYCFLGRLSHEKGIATLIEAANQLPYKLIIIGNGPQKEVLEAKSKSNVEFVGFKQWPEIKKYLSHAKFMVTPSEWYEVFGLVNMEALCLGTPVLGARIGGIPELIDEGVNGMTFKSGDANDLSEKIRLMMSASFNYQTIAETAQKKYSAESYYDKLMEIYRH
ncbi:MAG: glycosyltransferase [Bacteroidales bacterium]|nr:glycosyltransferase [Bacteroidales bacterium]